VTLNIDAGELPDDPEELYALADVLNVACGGHAGDEASMRRVLAACARAGTRAGAHPSFVDREGFGRRAVTVSPPRLCAEVAEQCELLLEQGDALGVKIAFVKPHGALYHAADADLALARAVVGGAVEALGYELTMVGRREARSRRPLRPRASGTRARASPIAASSPTGSSCREGSRARS
jgi:UPF0271 protein